MYADVRSPELCPNSLKLVKDTQSTSFLQRVAKDSLKKEHKARKGARMWLRFHSPRGPVPPGVVAVEEFRPRPLRMESGHTLPCPLHPRMPPPTQGRP